MGNKERLMIQDGVPDLDGRFEYIGDHMTIINMYHEY